MDSSNCQRIIQACKEVPFLDFTATSTGTDFSSVEPSHTEVSTPDNMTTESLTLTSHLAVQEKSFSDDAVSSHFVSTANTQSQSQSQSPKSRESGATSLDIEERSEKIVYCEVEKDTSCVIDMNEHVE